MIYFKSSAITTELVPLCWPRLFYQYHLSKNVNEMKESGGRTKKKVQTASEIREGPFLSWMFIFHDYKKSCTG